ncbi:MAG: DUF1328 family protein [Tranquillimonas sp.]
MFRWASVFLLGALIAGLAGFGGAASAFVGSAQIMFFVFLALFAAMLATRVLRRPDEREDL